MLNSAQMHGNKYLGLFGVPYWRCFYILGRCMNFWLLWWVECRFFCRPPVKICKIVFLRGDSDNKELRELV